MPLRGADLLTDDGPIAALLPGYESRSSQLEMARAVDAALTAAGNRLLVEAGTGVGKSLAYLAPAMTCGQRVVVATGTLALQEQLARDDAPLVAAALERLGLPAPRIEVVKGRHNYLCLLRHQRRAAAPELPQPADSTALGLLDDWLATTVTGDRAELTGLPDDWPLWRELDAGAETCVGTGCPRWRDCFVVRLRERARDSDLIITNHHLLMADEALRLQQRFGEIPDSAELLPDHGALIVDEAHGLYAVATDAFSASLSSVQIERLVRDCRGAATELPPRAASEIEQAAGRVERSGLAALAILGRADGAERTALVAGGRDAADQRAIWLALDELHALGGVLERSALEPALARALSLRSQRLGRALDFIAGGQDPGYVYYIESRPRGVRLVAAPVDVAQPLGETLLRPERDVVLTSATLCTDRGFEPLRQMIGLGAREPTVELQLPSPFPFAELVRIYLPGDPIIPDSDSHVERLSDELLGLCRAAGGGAFLLFTSYRVLDEVHARLAPELPYLTLRHGDAPRRVLLERFRADGNAVLFGTHSFWEGVDVRGSALRLVAVDRLPFDSPGDPLFAARQRLLEERGEHPFTALALPQAMLDLKQGVGRLVRSSTDRGVIAILDGRLVTRSYGRRFFAALPEAPVVRDLTQVADFFGRPDAALTRADCGDSARGGGRCAGPRTRPGRRGRSRRSTR
ncbi:MAG: ATP-dependent DNA helicase [Deltaproteobacteria bacterium]|nr:ATP-dependent DNA helicase [Deltaproteobacteria bacterium]